MVSVDVKHHERRLQIYYYLTTKEKLSDGFAEKCMSAQVTYQFVVAQTAISFEQTTTVTTNSTQIRYESRRN